MHAASHQNKQPRREYQGRGPRHNLSNQRRVSSRSTLVLSASLFAPPQQRAITAVNQPSKDRRAFCPEITLDFGDFPRSKNCHAEERGPEQRPQHQPTAQTRPTPEHCEINSET